MTPLNFPRPHRATDTARYIVALVAVVSFPPAPLIWFNVHPTIALWRGTRMSALG